MNFVTYKQNAFPDFHTARDFITNKSQCNFSDNLKLLITDITTLMLKSVISESELKETTDLRVTGGMIDRNTSHVCQADLTGFLFFSDSECDIFQSNTTTMNIFAQPNGLLLVSSGLGVNISKPCNVLMCTVNDLITVMDNPY